MGQRDPDTLPSVELAASGCERTCPEATETTTDAERPSPPREAGDAERRDRDGSRPCDSILAADVEDATNLERRLRFLLRLRRALDRERERSTELARPTPELGKAPESGTAIPVPEPGKAPGLEVGLLWEPTTLVKAGLVQAGLTSTNPGGAAAAGITPAGTGPPYTGPGATGKAFEPTHILHLESVPLPDQSAEKVAMAAIDNFFCTFGMPLTIHTDQGANFVGNVFKAVCDLLEIRKTQTTPYYPQGNGQVERYNRTIIEMIRCLKAKSDKDWDIYLPHITSAIRCLENPSTGFSANRLMLGREVSKPAHVHFGMSSPVSVSGSEYIKRLDFVMRETHRIARENLKGTLLRRKRDYDVKLKQESYEVGDFVYKLNYATKKGVSKKLQPLYDGPFIVTRVLSPVLIEIENRKRKKVVHHNKLKPCNDRFIPLWIRRRRQELLSLDDTLPYDADEHSFFNISDLLAQNDPHDNDVVVDDVNPPVDDQPGRGDQSTLANVSANDNEIPQTPNIDDISDNQDDIVPDNGVDLIAVPNAQNDPVSDFEGNSSPVPVRTRRGRTIRPNTLLRDFITY